MVDLGIIDFLAHGQNIINVIVCMTSVVGFFVHSCCVIVFPPSDATCIARSEWSSCDQLERKTGAHSGENSTAAGERWILISVNS